MTIEERKRAKLLEKVSNEYNKNGNVNLIVIITAIVIAAIDAVVFTIGVKENDFVMVMIVHNLIAYLIMGMMSSIPTTLIGDNTKAKDSALTYGSTMFTGKFLGTLPFSAKDMLNLRLINWEKQFLASTLITLALQIALVIAEYNGLNVEFGVIGNALMYYVLAEIFLLIVSLARSAVVQIIAAIIGANFTLVVLETGFRDKTGFMSGAGGIVFIVAAAVVLMFVAEFIVSKRKKISWGLK